MMEISPMNNLNEKPGVESFISKMQPFFYNTHDCGNHQDISQILDTLNSVNWNVVNDNQKIAYVRQCCPLSLPPDCVLIGKCGQVVLKIIQSFDISEDVAIMIVRWSLNFLTRSPDISQVELLLVLECVLNKNIDCCRPIVDDLLKNLKEPFENRTRVLNSGEVLLQRLKCIRALIPLLNNAHGRIVSDVLVELTHRNLKTNKYNKSCIILEQLEILTVLSEKNMSWLSDNLGVVLGICLSVASYGLPHHLDSVPQYLLPTSLLFPDNQSTASCKPNNKNKSRRKHNRNVTNKIKAAPLDDIMMLVDTTWSQTSDSDFSDCESGRVAFLKKSERKIRLSALTLLLQLVKTVNKRELVGHWNNILDGPYSILKTLSNDTSPRSRVAILSILSVLFTTGKMYLSQAQHAPRSANLPYLSWSHLLADLISSTHSVLCQVVSKAQSARTSFTTVQCLVILLRHTPYHRLNDGLLTNVVQSIRVLLKHVDCTVKLGAIKCLHEVVVFEPNTEEQIFLMRQSDVDESSMMNSSDSWIISYCIKSIENENISVVIRAECWVLLGNVIKHHFINISCGPQLPKIMSLLRRDLQDSNIVIQQKAAKAFEQIAVPLGSQDFKSSCSIDCYKLWSSMLQGPLVPMLQSTSGILAAAAADCIANITPTIFEQLPEHLRIFVMTALCGCVSHEEHIARSAAVRTLGTIVVFPFLSESIQVIYDVADRIVSGMKDDNLSVRTKAAWALGNLSDVLLNGRTIGIPIEEVSLLNLLEQAVLTGKDHEKVKACSMRAIGNLFLLVEDRHIQVERFRTLVVEAAATLVYNAENENNMKVRWNACYSLGNMFKNDLLATHVTCGWQEDAFEIMSKLIVGCTNFKVRQAAASALTTVSSKTFYGKYYVCLLPCLLQAFDNSQNLTEFSEYKHQRNLIDQLCLTLCHLTMFLDVDDIKIIDDLIVTYAESCKTYITDLRRRNDNVCEKFVQSESYLLNLKSKPSLGMKQRETISILIDIMRASH